MKNSFPQNSWILISASTSVFRLVEVDEETLDSHKYTIGKGRSILSILAFRENYGYSLILHQNLTTLINDQL